MEYPVFNTAKQSIFDVRRRARARAFVCPGAGFIALGYRKTGWLAFGTAVAALAAAMVTAAFPSPFWLRCSLVLAAAAALLWFVELAAAHSDQIDPAPQDGGLGKGHWIGAAILWSAVAALAVLVSASYSVFTVGSEMTPTLRSGKRLLVRRLVEPEKLVRGKLILFRLGPKNQRAEPGRLTIARIMALPGDQISLRSGRYVVNGAISQRAARAFDHHAPVVIAEQPETTKVPPGCYFVTQDSSTDGLDSAVLSWAAADDLVSTVVLDLSFSRLLEPINESPDEAAARRTLPPAAN